MRPKRYKVGERIVVPRPCEITIMQADSQSVRVDTSEPGNEVIMKTVKVRIAVAMNPYGQWDAVGWNDSHIEYETSASLSALNDLSERGAGSKGTQVFWINADVPIPPENEVQGHVTVDKPV